MKNQKRSQAEFVVLMAALMSIVALSIDAVLPALPEIGSYLNITNVNDTPQLITSIFLGLGCGQLIFGPLSDSFGRKPIIYTGFLIFVLASILCVTTKSFEIMILGRVIQGVGLASPRTMTIAMIRDSYDGDYMAKILSVVVMVFLLVPIIAPSLGQLLIQYYDWQSIFIFNLGFGFIVMLWFYLRQHETLKPQYKIKFSPKIYISGSIAFFKIQPAVIYTVISGLVTGSFMVYLSTSQRIFDKQYGLAEEFPLIFASLAIAISLATFINSQLVVKLGMLRLVKISMSCFVLVTLLFVILYPNGHNPSIEILIGFFAVQFFTLGFLFGNLRAIAMQPLGHIAGIGSALNGFISTVMAVPIANFIGSYVVNTVTPLFYGFLCCAGISLILLFTVKSKKKTNH